MAEITGSPEGQIRKKKSFFCLLQSSVVSNVFNPTFHFFRSSGRTGTVRDGKDEDDIELSMGGEVEEEKSEGWGKN